MVIKGDARSLEYGSYGLLGLGMRTCYTPDPRGQVDSLESTCRYKRRFILLQVLRGP